MIHGQFHCRPERTDKVKRFVVKRISLDSRFFKESIVIISQAGIQYTIKKQGDFVRLGTKTTLLLAAIVSPVIIIASLLLLHFQEDSLKKIIVEGLNGQAKMAAYGIDAFIAEGLNEAHAVALTLPVNDLLHGRTGLVEEHFKKMQQSFPRFQNGIFVLDKEGTFLADYPSHPELRGQSFAFREYYQRTFQERKGIAGSPYRSKRTGFPVLTFTSPILDSKGRIIAVLACSVDLLSEEALGGYRKQKFGESGYLFIVDHSRRLIVHPEDGRLLTYVEVGKNRIMEDALKGFEGGGETVNSKGIPMLMAVRQIQHAPWIVAVQTTQHEAYAPVSEVRQRIILVSAVILLLIILAGALLIRRVSTPLRQLERVASQISAELEGAEAKMDSNFAEDSLDTLRSIRFRDEIGMLASAFLHLATELKHTLGSLQRSAADWERTFHSVNEAVIILDKNSRIVRMNRTAEDWFRTSTEKAVGHYGYSVILGAVDVPKEWPNIASLSSRRKKVAWTHELERPRGIFEFTLSRVDESGEAAGAVLIISDVTMRVESEEHIREMAFYDQLTGLPNRFLLRDRILLALATASRNEKRAGIMFLDLDRFKEINDLYGHDAGDALLKQVSKEISQCLRKNDTLSRFGGDEFVIVLQDIEQPREAAAIAARIIEIQAFPMHIKEQEMTIRSSIGISIYPDDGEDGDVLLKNADIAMYSAKSLGRNNYQFFSKKAGGYE
jgi:diguanylate cyclase (GGDEF)-like protein/PAS domain S-box-containing protein